MSTEKFDFARLLGSLDELNVKDDSKLLGIDHNDKIYFIDNVNTLVFDEEGSFIESFYVNVNTVDWKFIHPGFSVNYRELIRKYVGALGRCKLEDRIHRLRDFEQCKCTSCGFEISEADERVATTIRDVFLK